MSIRARMAVKARQVRDGFRESQRNRALVAEARHAPRPDLEAAYQRIVDARGEVEVRQARTSFADTLRVAPVEERTRFARIPPLGHERSPR